MGLFTKRTTDKEWLEMVAPLCQQFTELNSETGNIFLASSTDVSPVFKHLDNLRSVAQQIKRLPTPDSSAAARAKGDYDSILSAVIEIKDIEARRKNFLIASKQSGQVDVKSLMKTNASGDKEHKLQDMVSEKGWRITEYLNDYFEDGDEPDGLLGW